MVNNKYTFGFGVDGMEQGRVLKSLNDVQFSSYDIISPGKQHLILLIIKIKSWI